MGLLRYGRGKAQHNARPAAESSAAHAARRHFPERGGSFSASMPASKSDRVQMKKLKHEAELFKAALHAGIEYAEGRKAVEFEATDSASAKALYVYRLLVHDKLIAPMPEEQVSERTVRHRLATWYAHQLPEGHPLLQ
ncbi:MAG TPA: DUF5062 family protein [Steroidobacteraceae bacterium]